MIPRFATIPLLVCMGVATRAAAFTLLRSDTTTTKTLPPVLQHITDERAEFQINLGRAMDTLKTDMPEILSRPPNYDIYHSDISVIDPSGVRLTGLDNYQSAIGFLQSFLRFWFQSPSSKIQYRLVYDFCRSSIRVSWNVQLTPKYFGGKLFVDGISYYQLDSESGLIVEHKLETLLINNTPVAPPFGLLSLFSTNPEQVPASVPAGVLGTGEPVFQ